MENRKSNRLIWLAIVLTNILILLTLYAGRGVLERVERVEAKLQEGEQQFFGLNLDLDEVQDR